MVIDIPHYKRVDIRHIVCDYNGTIARDGRLLPKIRELFRELASDYTIHVVTADTFGSVAKEMEGIDVEIKILETDDHTREKERFIVSLGAESCAALGNGNNDTAMLRISEIGIAIVGDEGCSVSAMTAGDLVCGDVENALELFLYPKRLIASLRR